MVAKKTVAKKAPKKTAKKVVHKSAATKHAAQMRSFHVYKDTVPFTSRQITRQTVYWTILLVVIMILQLWILKVLLDIATLTSQVNL